jgi:hypothetical protein
MKKLLLKRISMLFAALILFSTVAFSQLENVDFLRTVPADGIKYIQAYVAPWVNAFGAGLNGSWYNTAKPHKFGGFDVTLGMNMGIVPSSAETFDIASQGFSSALSFDQATSPTIAGSKNPNPQTHGTYTESGTILASFSTPEGTAWKYIPVPTLQVGIGLPLGTEIKGRFIPRLNIKGGDIMLWGVGLMHSITQYFPGDKLLPVDASIFAGYTRLEANVPLNLQPDASVAWDYPTIDEATYFNDQNLSTIISALNISAIASVNLKIITFYGGLGYTNTSTTAELTGFYPKPVYVSSPVPHAEYNESAESINTGAEFPKIDIKSFSGLRTNVGIRLKLSVITIYADYTRAHYNVISAGLGVSFR